MKNIFFLIFFLATSNLFGQVSKELAAKDNYPLDLNSIGLTLPESEDQELNRLLKDNNTIFYKMPQVWQHYVPSSTTQETNLTLGTTIYKTKKSIWNLYSVKYNPDSHANFNFPWETTAGLNSAFKEKNANFKTVNFINLPKNPNGKTIPIYVLQERPIKWIYPIGTTVGEVIYVNFNNRNYVQEIRTRKKLNDSTYWEPMVYRPVTNREEYIELTNSVKYIPAKKHMFFRNPQEDEVFKMDGLVECLPPLETDKVISLLSRKFKNATEENWSPCSIQDFHILPKDYCFSLIGGIDIESCSNCHRQTQISVRNLVPKDPSVINDPEGTGNIRGSDAVFTWHPFSASSISSNKDEYKQINFRNYDVSQGIVATKVDKEDLYKLTLFVQNSLKKYELPKNNSVLHERKDVLSTNKN
jgi:hypothetical protein